MLVVRHSLRRILRYLAVKPVHAINVVNGDGAESLIVMASEWMASLWPEPTSRPGKTCQQSSSKIHRTTSSNCMLEKRRLTNFKPVQLNRRAQQTDINPANSDQPIESRVNNHRRQVEHSDLVPIEVHISKRAPQPGPRVAGHESILDETGQADQRTACGGEQQTEEPGGRGEEVGGVEAGDEQVVRDGEVLCRAGGEEQSLECAAGEQPAADP